MKPPRTGRAPDCNRSLVSRSSAPSHLKSDKRRTNQEKQNEKLNIKQAISINLPWCAKVGAEKLISVVFSTQLIDWHLIKLIKSNWPPLNCWCYSTGAFCRVPEQLHFGTWTFLRKDFSTAGTQGVNWGLLSCNTDSLFVKYWLWLCAGKQECELQRERITPFKPKDLMWMQRWRHDRPNWWTEDVFHCCKLHNAVMTIDGDN